MQNPSSKAKSGIQIEDGATGAMQDHGFDADLWANWYGFGSAADMKDWHEQAKRERLAGLSDEAKEST